MAKYYGKIGYAVSMEYPEDSGIWVDRVIERHHKGDVLQNYKKWQNASQVNDNFSITNQISIVADSFATANIAKMKYLILEGTAWKIVNAEIQRPRIVITLGGVYNGEQARASCRTEEG